MLIRDVVPYFPGSCHDSWVLAQSAVFEEFERGEYGPYMILGDSGYPLKNWLMTPFNDRLPLNAHQLAFNASHKKERCLIERTIGVWKARWR